MEPVHSETYKGYTIKVYPDDCVEDPIKNWDMLGTFVSFHKEYDLGDTKEFVDPEEFQEYINKHKKDLLILPIYIYDHSGIGISTSNAQYPFNCPWDSGQVGWVYVTKQKLREEFGWKLITKSRRAKAFSLCGGEVELYNEYVRGEVYGYNIEDSKGEQIDSCWGYYGDIEKNLLLEARSMIDSEIKSRKQKHWRYLKGIIKNKVALCYRKEFKVC